MALLKFISGHRKVLAPHLRDIVHEEISSTSLLLQARCFHMLLQLVAAMSRYALQAIKESELRLEASRTH
jgi:hypothetical protein